MGDGRIINSEHDDISLNGLNKQQAIEAIAKWLESKKGKSAVTYKLRDWLFSRQRYWGSLSLFCILKMVQKRLLALDELPLCPPQINDFKPSGDGQSPLAKVKEWVEITDPKTGKKARRETNTMPQWAGSCWYYLRFCDPLNEDAAWDPKAERYWLPVDLYVGGVEHAVLHLLYSRFWHKVLYDCGCVSTLEPFKTLRNQGLITARSYQRSNGTYVEPGQTVEREGKWFERKTGEELKTQIEKMSKSKLNGVSPDEIIDEFGADALRLYEMFMGPLEKDKPWNTDAVSGCRRFLNRFFELVVSDKVTDEPSTEALKLGHRLVHGVGKDLEAMQFNTAIAKHMEFINDFCKLSGYPKVVLKMATQALGPLAPHLAEEMWEKLGSKGELSYAPWPTVDAKYLQDDTVTLIVQINGKLRASLNVDHNLSQEQVLAIAQATDGVARQSDGQTIRKVIFVPNRLLNIVV